MLTTHAVAALIPDIELAPHGELLQIARAQVGDDADQRDARPVIERNMDIRRSTPCVRHDQISVALLVWPEKQKAAKSKTYAAFKAVLGTTLQEFGRRYWNQKRRASL